MKKKVLVFLFLILFSIVAVAQHLKPGFDKSECLEMLKLGANFGDSTYAASVPKPLKLKQVYRSPIVGLDNCWELWMDNEGEAVISIRGSTIKAESWLENFYGAMVAAKGELHLADSFHFKYELAANPRAAVHIGWLIGTAFLSRDILPKIDSLYKTGLKDFIITGHSQGGAISFLMTSYLYSLQKEGRLAADIRFKTYCAAAPKVGNMYYAYDYEAMTQFGWAYNIVNSADWVPQGMFSIETVDDLNNTNAFPAIRSMISKQSFPKDLVLKHFYNQMDQPVRKAEYRFQECLGNFLAPYVKKFLPQYVPPVAYVNTMDYVRVGNVIVLLADDEYYKIYPDNPATPFVHHFAAPYYYLAQKLPPTSP